MKTNTVLITALFVISSFGCDKDDDLLIVDIESEKNLVRKPSIEEAINLSEYN